MNDNILVDNTIKLFENGVLEINKLKGAIIKLNGTIEEITNFNEIIDLEIDVDKVEDINKKLDLVINKHKQVLEYFEKSISILNEENEVKTNNIKLGIDGFYKEIKTINENLNLMDFNLNNRIIDELLKDLSQFINNIENKYEEISEKYNSIESVTDKTDNILSTVSNLEDIIDNTELDKKIKGTLDKINELDLKYDKVNQLVEKFNTNICTVNSKIENNNIFVKTNEILNDLEEFNKNATDEYKKIESVYDNINLINEKISYKYEERINSLEKKIDLLIDENKALKLAYSTRKIEDNIFKDEILNLINDIVHRSNKSYVEVESQDLDELKVLAKQGDINASFKLAQKYYQGKDIKKNVDLSVKYYLIGARQNHTESIKELIQVYKEEATKGNIKYQRILGLEYYKGMIIDLNIEESIKWLTIASEKGSQEAKNKLNKIKNEYNVT